jgi:hypothetical protein
VTTPFESLKQTLITHALSTLAHTQPSIQTQAIVTLQYLGSEDQLQSLLPYLQPDISTEVRLNAILAVAVIAGLSVLDLESFQACLLDDDPIIRWKAEEILELLNAGQPLMIPLPIYPSQDDFVAIIS